MAAKSEELSAARAQAVLPTRLGLCLQAVVAAGCPPDLLRLQVGKQQRSAGSAGARLLRRGSGAQVPGDLLHHYLQQASGRAGTWGLESAA